MKTLELVSVGDVFQHFDGDKYYLCTVAKGKMVALISFDTCNRWSEPIHVADMTSITEDELFLIFGGIREISFTRIDTFKNRWREAKASLPIDTARRLEI